jgi:hypothetical protein
MARLVNQINNGFRLAEQIILSVSYKIKLSDLISMKRVVLTMLRTNKLSFISSNHVNERNRMTTIILDAMLSSLDLDNGKPHVTVLSVLGSNVNDSFSAPNIVFMDIPISNQLSNSFQTVTRNDSAAQIPPAPPPPPAAAQDNGLKCILFDTSLESVVLPSSSTNVEEIFVESMVCNHVRVVASQKLIPRKLKRKLELHGILSLERISLRYMREVACVSGARVMSQRDLRELCHGDGGGDGGGGGRKTGGETGGAAGNSSSNSDSLEDKTGIDISTSKYGYLHSICIRRIGNKKFIQVKGFPNVKRPLSTIVLRAPSKYTLSELNDNVHSILHALPHMFRLPLVYPLDGKAEEIIAKKLIATSRTNAGYQMLGKAFQRLSEYRCENGTSKDDLVITKLYLNEIHQAVSAASACIRTL